MLWVHSSRAWALHSRPNSAVFFWLQKVAAAILRQAYSESERALPRVCSFKATPHLCQSFSGRAELRVNHIS